MSAGTREENIRAMKLDHFSIPLTPEYIIFFLSLILGSVIRLYLAFTAPINMDENFYAFDGHLLHQGLTPFQDFPTRSPLMIIISATILWCGGDFFTLRLVAVLFSMGTGILIFHSARIMGGLRIAATASALFFLSPYSIRYGYVFFTQPFEAFFVGISFTLIIHWISTIHADKSMKEKRIEKSSENIGIGDCGDKTDNQRLKAILRCHWQIFLAGIVLGLAVFIRRNALAFFPAGLLILTYYQLKNIRVGRPREIMNLARRFMPQLIFFLGFFLVLVPGIFLFIHVSGLSYTTYFFYSDYLQAHTGIIGNLSFSIMFFDSRGFYFLSVAMVFTTLVIHKSSRFMVSLFEIQERNVEVIMKIIRILLCMGWILALYAALGNNYLETDNGLWYGTVLLLLFLATFIFGWYLLAEKKLDPLYLGLGYLGMLILANLIVFFSGKDYFLSFNAIILVNALAAGILFRKELSRKVIFQKPSKTQFPDPLIASGIFFFCILLFYIFFRVILPYYYDLLFPLSIITAFFISEILDSMDGNEKNLFVVGKALFLATLIVSVPISIAEYHYGDSKLNETDIEEFRDCVEYLRGITEPGEVIFTAKAMIALEADLEIVFNIARPAPYKENDTKLLEKWDYPSILEIIDYLESESIRIIVVDWVMQNYFLDPYPQLNEYVQSHYIEEKRFGSISILVSSD